MKVTNAQHIYICKKEKKNSDKSGELFYADAFSFLIKLSVIRENTYFFVNYGAFYTGEQIF